MAGKAAGGFFVSKGFEDGTQKEVVAKCAGESEGVVESGGIYTITDTIITQNNTILFAFDTTVKLLVL
jgi:hypothetical protein